MKTRKTTVCFYPPAMPVVLSTFSLLFLPSLPLKIFFSWSVRLYHSILWLIFFSVTSFPLFPESYFCVPLNLSCSGLLGNQRTWITFIQGGDRMALRWWTLWFACQQEMPIKYCCEQLQQTCWSRANSEKKMTDTEREWDRAGGYSRI